MRKRNSPVCRASLIGMLTMAGILLAASLAAAPAGGLAAREMDLATPPAAAAAQLTEQQTPGAQTDPQLPAAQGSSHTSVLFIENAGQWDPGARFQVWGGPTGTVWLAEDAIWITVVGRQVDTEEVDKGRVDKVTAGNLEEPGGHCDDPLVYLPTCLPPLSSAVAIKLSFVDANPLPRIETFDRVDTVVSYFLGDDPDQWRPEVPVWGGVRYVELYPGVDLELNSDNGQMTPRLAVRPGADLSAVRLRVEGADAVAVDGDVLRLSTAAGEVTWPLLEIDGIEVGEVQVEAGDVKAFHLVAPFAPVNFQQPVNGDNQRSPFDNPADLLYGTFLGGSDYDYSYAIVVDGAGSAYVTGVTWSDNFPTTPGAFDPYYNGGNTEAFVIKLDPIGNALTYATFLGGRNGEYGYAIAVDGSGCAYMAGKTSSENFPTTPGAFDTSYNGSNVYEDAFVAKLNQTGSALAYATFLGGSREDGGLGIVVDGAGSAYVTGETHSSNFPTTPGAFDPSFNWRSDAFVAKLNQAGSALAYATFLGGSNNDDYGYAIAVDRADSAYVVGETNSEDFPTTTGAFDTSYNGDKDAFVVKLNSAGSGLTYATFLGGSSSDSGTCIAVDGEDSAYLTGGTLSSDFPTTPGAFDPSYNGNGSNDAFVVKLNPAGSALTYATFLGDSSWEEGWAIAVDDAGSAYVTGETDSSDFPTTSGAFDTSLSGYGDAFVVRLNSAGSALAYATFLGGNSYDEGWAIAVDGAGSAYVMGDTYSSNFPTTPGAFDPNFNGGSNDAFVVKLAMRETSATATATATPTRTSTPSNATLYLPLMLHRVPPIPDAPLLNAITAPGPNSSYNVHWNASQSATSYLVQRATSASFADAVQVYVGAATTYTAPSQGIARYYFRVQARNQYGSSPWCNVQWVDVRWEQEPNYPLAQANGPLLSGLDYYGYPNDQNDYFFFQVASRGQVTIDLANHTGNGVQLLLRTADGVQVAVVNQAPYHLVHTVDSGVYYVHIFTERDFNSTTSYTLRAVFPMTAGTSTPTPSATPLPTSTPTPTPTITSVPPPDDPYEPNNIFSQAWGPLVSAQVYRALIYAPSDQEDFYWFDMPSARSIQVDLWNIPAGNNYHLYLYQAQGLVGYSGNTGNIPESIQTGTLPAGRYYARVQRVTGYSATEQYSLRAVFR